MSLRCKFLRTYFLVIILSLSSQVQALEVSVSGGALHYLESSYHYLGYSIHAGIDSGQKFWTLDLGMAHPYSINGFTQRLAFGSIGVEWPGYSSPSQFITPFGGVGIGLMGESVTGSQPALIPALALTGGLKFGSPELGIRLAMHTYSGFHNFDLFHDWVFQPLVNFMAGLYVHF